MFKKRRRKEESGVPIPTTHPLFDFSVLAPDMRLAARDYSAIKAFAHIQQKDTSHQNKKEEHVHAPLKEQKKPLANVQKLATSKVRKPILSRFVILSGVFIFLAIAIGAGVFWWSVQNQSTEPIAPPITNPPISTPDTPISPPVTTITIEPGNDLDNDGLTDAEERLFRTNPRNSDTDEDTYLDNNEVFHGYDPTIPAPALLENSEIAQIYTYDGDPAFQFLRLNQWPVEAPDIIPDGSRGVLRMRTSGGAEFRITVYARGDVDTLDEWYMTRTDFQDAYGNLDPQQSFVSKQGYVGRTTDENQLILLESGEFITVFEYDLRTDRTIEYALIFQMIINSFTLLPDIRS